MNGGAGGGSLPLGGSVPVQPTDTRAGAKGVRAAAADPAALPGNNGARVVARKDAGGGVATGEEPEGAGEDGAGRGVRETTDWEDGPHGS